MLTLAGNMWIYLHTQPTDMRKSFDGLSGLVRSVFQADPTDGSLFLFINRRRDRIKMLWCDRDELALYWFAGSGWMPGRSTLLNIESAAAELIKPFIAYLRSEVLASEILGTDETRVTLLMPPEIPAARADKCSRHGRVTRCCRAICWRCTWSCMTSKTARAT